MQHVEHPVGQPRLTEQRGEPVRCRGILLARLQHHRVARGNGDRKEPHGHHGRKVERADDAHNTERLFGGVHVDTRRHVRRELALDEVGEPGSQLDHFEAAGDLTQGVGQHLAVFGGEDLGEFILALVEKLAEPEQDLLALGDRRVAPSRKSGLGGGHRGIDFRAVGQRHTLCLHPECRIEYRCRAPTLAVDRLAVDPVLHDRRRGALQGAGGGSCGF